MHKGNSQPARVDFALVRHKHEATAQAAARQEQQRTAKAAGGGAAPGVQGDAGGLAKPATDGHGVGDRLAVAASGAPRQPSPRHDSYSPARFQNSRQPPARGGLKSIPGGHSRGALQRVLIPVLCGRGVKGGRQLGRGSPPRLGLGPAGIRKGLGGYKLVGGGLARPVLVLVCMGQQRGSGNTQGCQMARTMPQVCPGICSASSCRQA